MDEKDDGGHAEGDKKEEEEGKEFEEGKVRAAVLEKGQVVRVSTTTLLSQLTCIS